MLCLIVMIVCSQVMWIMDKVFLVTNFGWVSWMHDDFFILAVSSTLYFALKNIFAHMFVF